MRNAHIISFLLCMVLIIYTACDYQPVVEKMISAPEEKQEEAPEIPTTVLTLVPDERGTAAVYPVKTAYDLTDIVSITASALDGYEFAAWKGTAASTDNPLVLCMNENQFIVPVYKKKDTYVLTVNDSAKGLITVSPQKDSYQKEETVQLSASPADGFEFAGWTGTVSSSENPLVIRMTGDHVVQPVFKDKETYAIVIDNPRGGGGSGGGASISPKKTLYELNEVVKITASANDGYVFKEWSGTQSSSQNPLYLTMRQNEYLTPVFVQEEHFTLSVSSSSGGKTVCSSPALSFKRGEKCSVEAVPDDGYEFAGWSGDIVSTDERVFITFSSDMQLYAKFKAADVQVSYTVTAATSSGGSVSYTPVKSFYPPGEIIHVQAQPDRGYVFDGWSSHPSYTAGCFDIAVTGNIDLSCRFKSREWTVVVYMAADNNLESAALLDCNELEGIDLNSAPVSILVLLDRAPGFDSTNGNWTGTRLYEIVSDSKGIDGIISSKQLICADLDLSTEYETELNTSDPNTLNKLLQFAAREYTAQEYALVVWGHGTGWRSGSVPAADSMPLFRASAIDDTSSSYMSMSSIHSAVKDMSLSVLAFDTCFGALLEAACEFASDTQYLAACEGISPSAGWDYTDVFTRFLAGDLSAYSFGVAAVDSYGEQYASMSGCSMSLIDLRNVPQLLSHFTAFTHAFSSAVNSSAEQLKYSALVKNSLSFRYASYPCDVFTDLYDIASRVSSAGGGALLMSCCANLLDAVENAVPYSWPRTPDRFPLALYLGQYDSFGKFVTAYPLSYTKGSSVLNTCAFVNGSYGWVPSYDDEISMIEKLFCEVF